MNPELMMKRKLLPMQGPNEPVSAAIATFVASVTVEAVVTGAIIGAVTSAVTGGNILKGALLGGLGGAVTSGLGGVFSGGEAAAAGAEQVVSSTGAEASLIEGGAKEAATTASGAADSLGSEAIATPVKSPTAEPIQETPLKPVGQNGDTGLAKGAGEDTSLTSGATKKTGLVETGGTGTAPSVKKTGLLNSITDKIGDKTIAAGLQVGGNALLGQVQGQAQGAMQEAKWAREDAQRQPGTIRIRTFSNTSRA